MPNKALRLCIIAQRFPVLARSSDHGFLWPIAKGLSQKGHEVIVISSKSKMGKHEIQRDGVQLYFLHDGSPEFVGEKFEKAALRKFKMLHEKKTFDLVHSIDRSGYLVAENKSQLKVAVAYDVEATQMSQLFSILGMGQETVGSLLSTGIAVVYKFLTTFFGSDRKLLKTADGIFVSSPQQRLFLERYYLYPDYKTYTVPYGMELADLRPREEASGLKSRWQLPDNAHILLAISDMTELQELKNLLVAFEKVAVKKPNAYMVIIGNGPIWKSVEFQVLSLALGRRVIMTGALSAEEISDWISVSEVYINLSSRGTGFEPAMIEAMSQKKVIIGSEVNPIANVVEDGVDGFLLRPADTDSLSHLLIDIFSGIVPIAEIGQKASEKVLKIFDTRLMIEAIEKAYLKILNDTHS